MEGKEIAILSARVAYQLRAKDIVILELKGLTDISDYFTICSATTEKQLRAIADKIIEELESQGITYLGLEGYTTASWILLDYISAVIHIFSEDARKFYDLELLWGDAPRIPWDEGTV